ncbi:MAG: hypothetical protein LBP34_00685 [Flavobacteriaceae bacterium]|nr:hypothetical protein [Flavobacteriaceae bacterium]
MFKLIVVQEYVHIKQHQEKQVHQDDCQVCHTIFQVGKCPVSEPDTYDLKLLSFTEPCQPVEIQYGFIYYNDISISELHNRPPPAFS